MRRCCLVLLLLFAKQAHAQVPVKSYSIKEGKMCVTLGKDISISSLDSFIKKYELADLDLKTFIQTHIADSINKLGWKVDLDNKEIVVICKPLFSADNITNPADKIIVTPKTGADIQYYLNTSYFGTNKFKSSQPFTVVDSTVTFFLRGQTNATRVKLAGSFTNWQSGALPMIKTDSGWIARVKLPAGKHLYKFIVDNDWRTDKDNTLIENDGMGNDNSVYFKTNYTFKLNGYDNAKKVYVSGSFNKWKERDLLLQRTTNGWMIPAYLPEGTHTYRFIVDGNWMIDPTNPDKQPNEFNDFNSVIKIGDPYIFKLDGFTNAKKVLLLGSFNNWKDNELFMNKTATGWELPYALGPGNYQYRLKIDGKLIADAVTKDNIALVIEPNFTFRLKGFDNAKTVAIAGDINGWNGNSYQMKREGNEWVFPAHLNKGKYRYKFVVDGKWILDPGNKLWEQNEFGTGNSVLWVDK